MRLMGCQIEVSLPEMENHNQVVDEVFEKLFYYNDIFSANSNISQLTKVNQQAGKKAVKVSDELFELVEIGKSKSLEQKGFLNIAIGPLIKLWRIGFNDANKPNDDAIKACLKLVNANDIVLNKQEKTIFLRFEGMEIDLGCIAKGYIADKIVTFLKSKQISYGIVNLGGNVVTFGENPKRSNRYFRIGIQNPNYTYRGNHLFCLGVLNKSIVTSGIYERFLEVDGIKYHHIFDGKTGYPVSSDIASITIVSDNSLDGEILTTQLFGLDTPEIISYVNTLPNIETCVIIKTNKVYMSNHFLKYICEE